MASAKTLGHGEKTDNNSVIEKQHSECVIFILIHFINNNDSLGVWNGTKNKEGNLCSVKRMSLRFLTQIAWKHLDKLIDSSDSRVVTRCFSA